MVWHMSSCMSVESSAHSSAQIGIDTVSWITAEGNERSAAVSPALLHEHFHRALPWRSGVQFQNRLNRHSRQYFASQRTHVWCESGLEAESLLSLDFDGLVRQIASQPMKISFADGSTHFPDFFATLRSGDQVLYDVKPSGRMTDASVEQFAKTADVCRTVGWKHQVLHELHPTKLRNLEWLRAARHTRYHPGRPELDRLVAVFADECTFRDGALKADHRGRNQRAPIPFTQLVDGMWSFIVTVYQNRPHKGLVLREHPGRTFTPNQMYSATFDASAGIAIPISQSDYISLMPRHDRTFQSDGIHLSNEIYDSPDLNEVRGRSGKHEIRQDPYDTERIWVRHPDNGEWITCFARSIRLAALPFGTSTTASLSVTAQADDPHTQWAQDFLDAESHRVKATHSGTDKGTQKTSSGKAAQKKATKTAAERANRKCDPLPRPAAVEPMQLPTAVPVREHPDDYTVA